MIANAAAVLLLYLSSNSAQSGMTVTSAEFETIAACEAAGRRAKEQLGTLFTTVRWSCSPKGSAQGEPSAPQSR